MSQPDKCVCTGPGLCPVFQRQITPHRWSLCQSRQDYRNAFAREREASEDRAAASAPSVPCVHRGKFTRQDTCRMDVCIGGPVVDVFACTLGGECTVNQHAIPGLKVCRKCDDRTAVAAPPTPAPIAVVIVSHEYGRFLAAALNSVLAQDSPAAEILVVDDASTDDTADVAATFSDRGVRYLRVEHRSAHAARGAGLAATSAPWLCFLDADDELPADYLSAAQRQFADGVAIVFSDVQNFGARTDRIDFAPREITVQNFIHAGCVVRRIALESCRAFDDRLPENVAEDWWTWRQVTRDGWKVAKSPALYGYRRHPESRSTRLHQSSYYERAGIALDELTISIPFSGRRQWWPRMRGWLEHQTWPRSQTRLLFIDSSGDPDFGRMLKTWLTESEGWRGFQYVRHDADPGLADANRHNHDIYRAVQREMPRVYNPLRHLVATPWMLNIEDDIEAPPDAAERLLRSFTDQVASVSGVYRSRYQDAFVAWPVGPGLPASFTEAGTGVQQVGGNGFGCVMLRTSVLRDAVFHHGGLRGDFDPNFYAELPTGWRALLDWSVRCRHADLE